MQTSAESEKFKMNIQEYLLLFFRTIPTADLITRNKFEDALKLLVLERDRLVEERNARESQSDNRSLRPAASAVMVFDALWSLFLKTTTDGATRFESELRAFIYSEERTIIRLQKDLLTLETIEARWKDAASERDRYSEENRILTTDRNQILAARDRLVEENHKLKGHERVSDNPRVGNACPARIVAHQYKEHDLHETLPHEGREISLTIDFSAGAWKKVEICKHCSSLFIIGEIL